MSGAEADVSSDGETSFEDEDVPLPPSPLKDGREEPFQVVLKGGSPWGFDLQAGHGSSSTVLISNLEADGKASQSGLIQLGDYLLEVNGVRCKDVAEASQLIDCAFRTLTLSMWRGATDSLSPPVRSASFLQKTRELSERARQAAVQDDSVLFTESKSSSAKMKPRQRRIESFHGGRRGSAQSSSSSASVSANNSTPRLAQNVDVNQNTPPTSSSENSSKPGLKGWATEHDLTSSRQPVIMSGSHMTRNVPLTSAKSTPSLAPDDSVNSTSTPRGYPKSPPVLNMTKSSTDIPENVNYENITSPTSPKSPSWYQQKFPNRPVFDFSTSSRRNAGSPRNSYAGGSPRNSYAGGSPRNSYAGGSPRNSYAGYSSSYTPSNYPQSPVSGFAPMSISGSMLSQTITDSNSKSGANSYSNNQKANGAKTYSADDTPTHSSSKNYDRRSLPPQALYQYRQEFQRENSKESSKPLTSMPVTREVDELDKEVSDIKPGLANDYDPRPMYSPPAPPVRDISSLKYVGYKQNHEKYPSWPVTTGQPPQNLGPPIDTHHGENGKEVELKTDKTENKIHMEVIKSEDQKRSPSVERRGSDETKQNRNQSDPGFKQRPKKSFYTTRKPKEQSVSDNRPEGERFDEFCRQSKPGYPPPKLDPDGHNYGDEKYSIPSPPERDIPNLDEKSLVAKIAAVISPNSSYQPSYQHSHHYNMAPESSSRSNKAENSSMQSKTNKVPGMYFQQAMNAQNLLRVNDSQKKNMVDSGTSPLQSPCEEKGKPFRTLSPNPRAESVSSPIEKSRGLIIKQMPYYNTSTQTDDSLASQSKSENDMYQSGQGLNSLSSVSSSASTMKSDSSSQSSGIGTLTFSDHSSAPMLRKLSEEFYRGKLSGTVQNEKRMSSASTYEDLKSPRSDTTFGGMKEAESYSSVVIHAHESSGPFGRDDMGSSPSISTKHDGSDIEHDPYSDHRHKARYSMDSSMLLHKHSGSVSMNLPQKSLNNSRFTSESNLSGGPRNHSQSLIHLNRPSSSLGEANQPNQFTQSAYSSSSSSTSSRPHGSMEARSSGSRVSSDSSVNAKIDKQRHGSDSVFYENKNSPIPQDNKLERNSETNEKMSTLGRKESMKMAYGTYDETEHHYATPYAHQRNNSEVLSSNLQDKNTVHGRSMSFNDYMPMHFSPGEAQRLGQIKEESEMRWQEMVKKSKSLPRESVSNYENITIEPKDDSSIKTRESEKLDSENRKESKSGLRRFASEQIRPSKQDKKQSRMSDNSSRSGYSSSGGESSKGNKSDSDSGQKTLSHQQLSDSDLKQVQQKALMDFVERKIERSRGSDSSEPQSPKVKDTSPNFPPPPPPESTTGNSSLPPQPSSPLADITKRYNYTKAQRNESLRRTQSITSNSSRDSTSDYMDMKRLERNSYQTEWSRLRSQDGLHPRRPLSIGSDITSMEHVPAATSTPDGEPVHQRSSSETIPKHILAEQDSMENVSPTSAVPPHLSNDGMVTSPIYHNLSGGDYPRRPPPPVPGANEETPPALPPRSYQKFASSKSESYLLTRVDQKQREELKDNYNRDNGAGMGTSRWDSSGTGTLREDAYAQQLRKQARRFSEQHKPISMQVVSTKSTVHVSLSQSYKQEPTTALEAVPVQKLSPTVAPSQMAFHHSPPSVQGRKSPEPPPLPTPLKNGETEIAVDLNKTADFPPPPSEFIESATAEEKKDRCADDSYGSYKTRTAPREVGKYTRTTSDSSLLHSHRERKGFAPHGDLSSKDVAEITPNKPPRKKLELQGRNSPTQGYRSQSPSMPGVENHVTSQKPPSHLPTYQSAEVTSVQHPHKSMARPLQGLSVHKYASSSSSSGSFVSTVVQRPTMSPQDRSPTPEEQRTSVRDRVKNIEVFTHSPLGSGQRAQTPTGRRGSTSPESKRETNVANSLEELESSIKSADSFRDRLRPVVKKLDPEQNEIRSSTDNLSNSDVADSVKLSPPPEIPSRTYRQKASTPNEPVYRRNSFQKHNAVPRPYESKTTNSANIHNPLNQNNFMNYKPGTSPEPMRSPSQSVPEPQVPARIQKSVSGSSIEQQTYRDQNSNIPSPESRLNHSDDRIQVKDNTQLNNSVQSGQKRNYESSFSRSRNLSGGNTPNNVEIRYHDKTVANNHNRHSNNTSSDQSFNDKNISYKNEQRVGHSSRTEFKGDNSFETRSKPSPSVDQKSSSRNYNGDSHSWRSDVNHTDNQSVPQNKQQSVSNVQTKGHSLKEVKDDQGQSSNSDAKDKQGSHLVTVNHGRQASAEEIECDKKAKELAKVLKGSDKVLSDVLTSDSKKIRMQYLDGILPVETDVVEERRPRTGTKNSVSTEEEKEKKEDEPTSPMPSNYYVSPPKAMIELEIRKFGDQLTQDIGDSDELAHRKEELLQSLIKKVEVLKHDKKELLIDIEDNESLGKQVLVNVENKCRNQQEKDKYRSYIDDIDKIIRLLLKLSGLLARAENTIQGLTEDANEKIKKMSYDKRDRLYKQHEDAKELKLDIDRRSEQVETILQECFTQSELYEYHQYIKMKSKYTIQMQEMEDKITLGNEQIMALQKSIPAKIKS
ncbi:melanosome organization [Mactra antiquata]